MVTAALEPSDMGLSYGYPAALNHRLSHGSHCLRDLRNRLPWGVPRLPESTSDTRLRLPNNSTKSFGASPCCSIAPTDTDFTNWHELKLAD